MALDMFATFSFNISDGTLDKQFKDTNSVDIFAYGWGVTQQYSRASGGATTGSKATFGDLSLTMYRSPLSAILFGNLAAGTHFASLLLSIRPVSVGRPVVVATYKMAAVAVTSMTTATTAGDDRETEIITFDYNSIVISNTLQKADGTAGKTTSRGWDLSRNVATS